MLVYYSLTLNLNFSSVLHICSRRGAVSYDILRFSQDNSYIIDDSIYMKLLLGLPKTSIAVLPISNLSL